MSTQATQLSNEELAGLGDAIKVAQAERDEAQRVAEAKKRQRQNDRQRLDWVQERIHRYEESIAERRPAVVALEKIIEEEQARLDRGDVRSTASKELALFLRHAETALYQAKEIGADTLEMVRPIKPNSGVTREASTSPHRILLQLDDSVDWSKPIRVFAEPLKELKQEEAKLLKRLDQ